MDGEQSSYGTPKMERTNWINRRKNSFFDDSLSANYEKKQMNKRKRVVKKGGSTSVTYKNISKKRRRYFSDLYTTLLDSSWSYCVLMFTASFYLSWLLFAIIYYIIGVAHGDFENYGKTVSCPGVPMVQDNSTETCPCILEVHDFASCFLFSLETQHTIGYGTRQTTTECPTAMIIVSLQSVIGCLIQAFMVGLVFSKLSRPQLRQKTVIFSNHAVITLRNRKLCLIFRIGDLRDDNFILGTQVSPDSSEESNIFFVWPLEVVHVIDKDSPLFDLNSTDLAKEKFELIVIMEGTIETSSMTFQARSSYLPNEILWGHRFESMVLYRKDHNKFQINNVHNHMPHALTMMDAALAHPFSSEEHDSHSQPPSVINTMSHDVTHPLLGSEFRSNSVSGGRPSVINKTSINSMGLGGLGNSNSFTGNNSRNDSNKTSNNSNRSSGNSGESGVTDRERKNTYYSDSEEREESLELEAGAGERRESGAPALTLMTEAGSGWQMGSRQFVAGNEIA